MSPSMKPIAPCRSSLGSKAEWLMECGSCELRDSRTTISSREFLRRRTEETRSVHAGNEALRGPTIRNVLFAKGFGQGGFLNVNAVEQCCNSWHKHDSKANPISRMQADSKKH